jgi:hypothetical protein
MFARTAFFRLKSVSVSAEFNQTFTNEVLPFLRKQKGFLGELMLGNPGSLEIIATSVWASRAEADVYDTHAYREVLQLLAKTVDGTPKIRTYDAVNFSLSDAAN